MRIFSSSRPPSRDTRARSPKWKTKTNEWKPEKSFPQEFRGTKINWTIFFILQSLHVVDYICFASLAAYKTLRRKSLINRRCRNYHWINRFPIYFEYNVESTYSCVSWNNSLFLLVWPSNIEYLAILLVRILF